MTLLTNHTFRKKISPYLSHETRDYRYGYGPSLTQRSPRHVHSNSDVISRGPGYVSRGTIHPYSRDLSDLQESFGCELYVNQRTLTTSPSYLTQPPMISDLSTQWQLS